jgi:hypothetical protein
VTQPARGLRCARQECSFATTTCAPPRCCSFFGFLPGELCRGLRGKFSALPFEALIVFAFTLFLFPLLLLFTALLFFDHALQLRLRGGMKERERERKREREREEKCACVRYRIYCAL